MTLLNCSNMSDSLVLFSSDDEDSEANCETKQYNNFTALLKGIPPPSSITISKFTVEEMLQRYKDYEDSSGFFFESENCTYVPSRKNPVPFLKNLNSSHISEKIASLIQKVQERYVQLETMSSCNVWFNATLQSCGSAKKRQQTRQRMGVSPGRRLSHLARRRQFFSSANLQRLANLDVRQIEIKKSVSHRSERKNITRTVEREKLNSSKRALFLSPENGTPTKYGNTVSVGGKIFSSGSDEKQKLPLQEKSKKIEVLKWLSQQNFEADFRRKRPRGESDYSTNERKRKCPRRSLNFADEEVPKSSNSVATSDSSSSTKRKISVSLSKLSQNHKNKLLWAVSVVLKEHNISRDNEKFKACASTLFHKCRRNLDEILNIQSASGTSEKILCFARKEIPAIFTELGIQPRISNEDKKNTKESGNFESKNEMKENICRYSSEISDCSKSKCLDGDLDFVFKTPNKICRKRPVKSCQKAESSAKKKTTRKWRSLESLKDDDIQKSCLKPIDTLDGISVLENSSNGPYLNEISARACAAKANINNVLLAQETVENKCLNIEESSVDFSPIPSSLKDEYNSPRALFPALNCSPGKSDVNSDTNSVLSEANESAEILNQDKEIRRGIENILLKKNGNNENFSKSDSVSIGTSQVANEKMVFGIEHSTKIVKEREEDRYVGSDVLHTEESGDKEQHYSVNFVSDSAADCNTTEDGVDELGGAVGASVEKAIYKPRKLVVKKSKPNWKVVRQNSEEAENESELRLKMRLSHEWEIVCRNSSCSDVGNASECEAASVSCSQISSTNDEKDLSSEMDADDSNRHSSAQSADESMDCVWEKPGTSTQHNEMSELRSVCSNTHNLNSDAKKEGINNHCSVMENDIGKLLHPQGQLFKIQQDEASFSNYKKFCSFNFLNRTIDSETTERNVLHQRVVGKDFSDEDTVNDKFESSLGYGDLYRSVLSTSCGGNLGHEEDRSFSAGYSHSLYKSGDSPILFVENHTSSERDSSKISRHLVGSPGKVEKDDFRRKGEWNGDMIHNILKMDNRLFTFPKGRRDCCL